MEEEAAATARARRRARGASAWAERYAERAGDADRRPVDGSAFSDSSDAGRAGRPRSTGHRRTARPAADRGSLALSPAERREAGEVPSETRRRRTDGLGSRRSRHDRGRTGRPRSTSPAWGSLRSAGGFLDLMDGMDGMDSEPRSAAACNASDPPDACGPPGANDDSFQSGPAAGCPPSAASARGSTTRLPSAFATRRAAPPARASRCRSSPAAEARRDAPPRRRSPRPPS